MICRTNMSVSTRNTAADRIEVAAGIITDHSGRVLVAQRNYPHHQFGKWEFPGGKLKPGETVEQALRRECLEELGIYVSRTEPLITVRHDYPERKVTLNVLRVTAYRGVAVGREGQALQWLAPDDLATVDLLSGNRPVVKSLQLPDRYLITAAARFGCARILSALDAGLQPGGLVQVREKHMDDYAWHEFVRVVAGRCRACGARVLINAAPETALGMDVDGIHLTSARLRACQHRPLPRSYWVAASCHNAEELAMAERIDADFAVLGPVFETESHPGAVPLGWERFAVLCHGANLPVFALGGMDLDHLSEAKHAGAQGVAMLSAAWGG